MERGMLANPHVCVAVRFRPVKDGSDMDNDDGIRELRRSGTMRNLCIQYDDYSVKVTECRVSDVDVRFPTTAPIRPPAMSFTFDAVLPETATQQEVYDRIGAPVVANVLRGCDSTLLVYGKTGSGKTHSMIGPVSGGKDVFSPDSSDYSLRGIMPRIMEELFENIGFLNPLKFTWRVIFTMFEIYKENIIDLLCQGPQEPGCYRICEDTLGNKGVYVESLEEVECHSAAQVLELMWGGMLRRHNAATAVDDTSYRSHLLMCVVLEQKDLMACGAVTSSRLNLVDLAGSERISSTLTDGERLREAQCIDVSLMLLGNAISRLDDENMACFPYRKSKLTHILWGSLGGNSFTTLLCNGSVAVADLDETVSTLRFAQKVKWVSKQPHASSELVPPEMEVQHVCAVSKIQELENRIREQNELIEVQRMALQNVPHPGDVARLRSLLSSVGKEVEELKTKLSAREKDLQHERESLEFYRQQCSELKGIMGLRTKQNVLETRLLPSFRLPDDGWQSQRELSSLHLKSDSVRQSVWKPLVPLHIANSMTLQEDCNYDEEVDLTIGHHSPPSRSSDVLCVGPHPPNTLRKCRRRRQPRPYPHQGTLCDTTEAAGGSCLQGEELDEVAYDEAPPTTLLSPKESNKTSVSELKEKVLRDTLGDLDSVAGQCGVHEHQHVFSSLLRSLQELYTIIPPLVAPDILENHLYRALRVVFDVLHTVNRQQNPMFLLHDFELQMENASVSTELPENMVTNGVMLSVFYAILDVLAIDAGGLNSGAANGERVGIDGFNYGELLYSAVAALRSISGFRCNATLAQLTTAEVVQAIDAMENYIAGRTGVVVNDGTDITWCAEKEVIAARTVLNGALRHIVAAMNAEMLVIFRQRLHGGLSLNETMLALRVVEDQVSALRGTANVRAAMLQDKTCNAMEVIQGIIRSLSTPGQLETPAAAAATGKLTSEEMVQSVHILRDHATLASEADADLLAVYHTEELQQALWELQFALSTSVNEANFKEEEQEDECMDQSGVQRALWSIAKYAAVLDNRRSEEKVVARLMTPAALHALGVVASLMDGAAEMYASMCDGTAPLDANGMARLRDTSAALDAFIQIASSPVAVGGSDSSHVHQTQDEEEKERRKRGGKVVVTKTPVVGAEQVQVRSPSSEPRQSNALMIAEHVLQVLVCKMSEEPGSLTAEEQRVVMALNEIASLAGRVKISAPICEAADANSANSSSLVKKFSVMREEYSVPTNFDAHEHHQRMCQQQQQQQRQVMLLEDKPVQTDECLTDIAACMELFLGARALLTEKGMKRGSEAVELLSTISLMQRQLSYMQHVREPVLQHQVAQQQLELERVSDALKSIQRLIHIHQPPCSRSSSGDEWRVLPPTLSEKIKGEVSLLKGHSRSPLQHIDSRTHKSLDGIKRASSAVCRGVASATTPAAATAHQVAEDVSVWFREWMAVHACTVQHDRETSARAARLEEELDTASCERDRYRDDVNELNDVISKLHNENVVMCELLSALYSDPDYHVERVEMQSAANPVLRAEAITLKGAAADLRRIAGQVELCAMAETEMRMRWEDFQAIDVEATRLHTLCDKDLAERKRKLLRHALHGLLRSSQRILVVLQQQHFDTGSLESQRLYLLSSLGVFTQEVEDALVRLDPVDLTRPG